MKWTSICYAPLVVVTPQQFSKEEGNKSVRLLCTKKALFILKGIHYNIMALRCYHEHMMAIKLDQLKKIHCCYWFDTVI